MRIILSITILILISTIFVVFVFIKPHQNKSKISNDIVSNQFLEITFPQDNSLTQRQSLKIFGKTQPNSIIAALSDIDSQLQIASPSGQFSLDFNLKPGLNEIEISSVNNKGQKADKILQTYYEIENSQDY